MLGCGSHEGQAPTPTPTLPAPAVEHAEPAAVPAPAPQVAVPAEPVNLLDAIRTEVATSSVYRDHTNQIAHLFDGDVESAWNSRTGDLESPWIEIRLPADAQVTSMQMTAGLTRTGSSGLFTQNHRVARVRVLHDGQELGVYPLDTASRELQTLPVTGGGGVYRLELVELLPGSRSDWREACVSELRVLGRVPGAHEGTHFPRFAAAALSEPRADVTPTDPAALARALSRQASRFVSAWPGYERDIILSDMSTGEPGLTRAEINDTLRTRHHLLQA